jgi:acetyltransferase-like isoleucine patch superfamily enzyme
MGKAEQLGKLLGDSTAKRVRPSHLARELRPDPAFIAQFAKHLAAAHGQDALEGLLDRFAHGSTEFDAMMRAIFWRARGVELGAAVTIGRGVLLRDPGSFSFGRGTVIGDGVRLQSRWDGRCVIGERVWVGPQSFIDGRDLVIGDEVGIGPGVRIIGSQHTGLPDDAPVIATDLDIRPIRIEDGADIGANATILPGITIGRGAIVGAGAVVSRDISAGAVAAGVPARIIRKRKDRKR